MSWTKFGNRMMTCVSFPAVRFSKGHLSLNTYFEEKIGDAYQYVSLFFDAGEKKLALWFHKNKVSECFRLTRHHEKAYGAVVTCHRLVDAIQATTLSDSKMREWTAASKIDYLDSPTEKVDNLWLAYLDPISKDRAEK